MALTQQTETGKIEITGPYKILSVRTDKVILDDDVEISRSYSRCTFAPGDSVDGCTDEVQALAGLLHTAELTAAYAAFLAE